MFEIFENPWFYSTLIIGMVGGWYYGKSKMYKKIYNTTLAKSFTLSAENQALKDERQNTKGGAGDV